MGSFKGHALPGTLFLIIGVWHMWSTIMRYVSNPKSFRVRMWNPVPGFDGKLKYFEIYVIAVGSFIDMCIEFFYSTHLKIIVNGVLNPSHMNDFEHAGMLLMFFLLGLVAIFSETTSYLPLPEGALCLIAATAFCGEYLLFYFHSTTHSGLEGYYHFVLVLLILLCVLSCIAGALFPTSFPVDLMNGIGITLQGLWFYQTAFTLYGSMMPKGCHLKLNDVVCRSSELEIRGEILANFQLFALIFAVIVTILGFYWLAVTQHPDSRNLLSVADESDT
ncbi:Transmembrane protein [Nymphaea thermarum]|nr:Transmembrane protein [Nymphaea thermarum]